LEILNALKRLKILGSDPVIIFALLLASGCTTTTSGSWEDPHTTNAPYQHVLIVALTQSDDMRISLERQLAENLAVGGSRASVSMSMATASKDAPRTRETILAMVKEKNADAVLLLRVADASIGLGKSKKEKDKYLFGGSIEDEATSKKEQDTWATPRTSNSTDALPDSKIKAEMTADLYDIADNVRVVYSIDVKTRHKEKGGEMIFYLASNIAEGVANKLLSEGLVK
jgi:hypothetical protein